MHKFYSVVVIFDRHFEKGNLKGLVYDDDYIMFPGINDAERWIEGVKENCKEIRNCRTFVLS